MSTSAYHLTCTQNVNIADGIYDFRFTRPPEFKFKAGQFVLFDVPAPDNPQDFQTRAFSIASSPTENSLIFVAKLIENGRASHWIESTLTTGDVVKTQGPFGRFTLDLHSEKELLFICTSTGVAPFRSQIIDALSHGERRTMDLIFGARCEADLFWQEELKTLQKENSNLHTHTVLSKPSSSWKGLTGHVQDIVPTLNENLSLKNVYICGNPDMTNELKHLCLKEWGVQKEDLHVEGYI
jgi:ferredoxin-NADP reductase